MLLNSNDMTPLYIQIANGIEDDILCGKLHVGDACYSQLIIARELKVNPATAAKGINLLVERGILVKQRGLPMVVHANAFEIICERKKAEDFQVLCKKLVVEAELLAIPKDEVLEKISSMFKEEKK